MTIFLILLVVALLGITFWQLSKILELSQGSADNSQVANDKDNSMQGKLMLAFVGFLYFLTVWCFVKYDSYFLPEAASEHGTDYDRLMMISVVLIMFVQIITQGLLHFFAYKYRGKKENKATFFADSNLLEIIWTAIPIVTLAALIIYGLYTWVDIMSIDDDEDALVVELYAYQFDWRARYAGADNELGKANVRFIEGVNILGVDASDNYAQDDIIVNELHLPVGKKVIFKMRSQDVLHSAYMPFFRAQMNVVPGMITEFSYTPTKTTEEMRTSEFMVEKVETINTIRKAKSKDLLAKGEEALEPYEFDYYLLCNKICGASHFNMQMKIIVESEEDYNNWIAEQKTFRQVVSK
ncbi:cytochrome c oxidase subunit II [Aquimarina agarilytica]|uniref:cytochrome c oxidase subunit II n=1 Tax=Aquimarina agarilytica TaxID=1087449 RepID=UPI000287AD6A|nr:cytochrome c oxidase subunit II [Aquimarina agarilytica]